MNCRDIETLRNQVRTLDYVRGTPAEVAMWREADAEARANLTIEGMDLTIGEQALVEMLRDEAVPPPLATAIVLNLLDHPDADPSLPTTTLARLTNIEQIGRASSRERVCQSQ